MTKTTFFKTMLLAIAIMVGSVSAWGQTLIAGWDFQTTTSGGTAIAAAPNSPKVYVANIGTGTLYLDGTNGSSTWITATTGNEVTAFGGTALNAGTGFSATTTSPACLALIGGASPYTANGKFMVFKFSMTGKSNLIVSYATQKTTTGFSSQVWEYSTNGTTWTAAQTISTIPAAFAVTTLTTITGLDNASTAYLRLSLTGATATAGNNRIDNIQLNASSSSSSTPMLTADATQNDVDHNIDITFTDDATWRAAITAVKVGSTALTATTDYTISAGDIQLKPSGLNALLTAAGSKSITVTATGYGDATVTQVINAGTTVAANSTVSVSPALAVNTSSTATLTAKDQYGNVVSGYNFKYITTVTNNTSTTTESYTIDGVANSGSVLGLITTATNASGIVTFTILMPPVIDPQDGISIQAKLSDGSTSVGSAFSFTQLQAQTITFGALSAVTYGDATFDLAATASSTLAVSYVSSNTGVATVSGSTVTIVGAGSTNITASQTGNGTYNAAANVIQALTVNPKSLTLPDAAVTSKPYDGTNAAVITGTLTGIINSDNVTLTGTGTFADVNVANGIAVTSTSTLGGTKAANYSLSQPTGLTGNITIANQTITFGAISNKPVSLGTFTLGATASSGLTVTYTSSNQSVATVSGNTVTILAVGSTDITAIQAGNGNYIAATNVIQTLTVVTGTALGNVIITEVYGGGGNSGTTYKTDFVELFNTTSANIDISGWSIQYYSAAGTGLCGNVFEIPAGKIINAFSHFLIQGAAGGSGTMDIPTADATCILNFSGTGGKIILYNTNAAQTIDITSISSITGNSSFMDYVPYGTATPIWGSALAATTNTTSASRKYVSGSFSYTSNVGNDFEIVAPNPKNSGITTQVISPVSTLSVSASDGVIRFTAESGQVIELYNAVGQKLLINQTVAGLNSIPVSAKGLVVLKVGNQIAKVVL